MQKGNVILSAFIALPLALSLACGNPPTPTPAPTVDVIQAIELTAGAASTQTAAAIPTNTFTPYPFDSATLAPVIGITDFPTFTPVPPLELLQTATLAGSMPTLAIPPPPDGACSCNGDNLNCTDFSSHASAQACYEYCKSQGKGDIHKLDRDGDGSACEG